VRTPQSSVNFVFVSFYVLDGVCWVYLRVMLCSCYEELKSLYVRRSWDKGYQLKKITRWYAHTISWSRIFCIEKQNFR